MDLKLDKVSYDGEWFEFGDMRLKVRPYPASRSMLTVRDGAIIISGMENFNKFAYCLVEWEGTADKLTAEIKKKIYDFRLGRTKIDDNDICMSDFVIQKADELFQKAEALEKN